MTNDAHAPPCIVGRCSRSADYGRWCCQPCADTMRAQLADIPDYAAALDAQPGKGGESGQRQAPGFGSRSPARDDIIAASDPRSLPYALGPDDEDTAVRPVLPTLAHLAAWIAEETGDQRDQHEPTITSEAGYLRSRIDWTTGQAWVDELATDIAELHGQCKRLAGDPPPKPTAPCPHCGGPLWSRGETDTVSLRCGTCSATYNGLDLLGIAARQDPAA